VNGKVVWLCDKHKRAVRSKTEERYGDQLETKQEEIPIEGKILNNFQKRLRMFRFLRLVL